MSRITVTVEGGLLADDLLERIVDGSAPGQRAADFGLATGRLSDEIMRAFSDAQSYWTAFKHRHERASKSGRESVTTITRESFVLPLLEVLAYNLEFKRSITAGDQSFVISHTSGDEPTAPPVNIVGADDKLDERGSSRRSAHSSVQEYLNVSDCLWGLATNGNKLRLLRDSSRLAKPRYIEFDLAGMMESNVYSDFHLLYRLLHRTRLPHSSADASECWLEKYYQDGIEQGSRVRDRLRDGVVEALNLFGNAFLAHPQSEYLRKRIAAGELTGAAYYRELLRLVYRLLFLMVAEERRLMFPDSRENERRRAIFSEHYGVNRLRARAERYIGDDPEIDLWESLKQAFLILRDDRAAHALGMAALNGELFGPHGCPHLDGGGDPEQSAFCSNDKLLRAIHSLSTFDDEGTRRRVNFGALDVEELGSVYESLLEYHPQLSLSPQSFDLVSGSERKTTGSYYTPPDLVRELINSALVPLIEDRLKTAKTKEDREKEILSMRVIDPAAGSGHFLLAAARRMGRELAKIRTGEEEPSPSAFRHAVRDIIRECIYAVDKNPLAVDLCKVALWIEGHNAGQPLSFLDHHVKCGDSLVGVFDLKVLERGVPDDAYKALEGDDKAAAKHYRRSNAETRKNKPSLPTFNQLPNQVVTALEALSHRDERTPEDVTAKEREYAELTDSPAMQNLEHACNAWTAAFFVPLRMPEFRGRDLVPTSTTVWERLSGRQVYGLLDAEIAKARVAYSFFHWPVEYPDVFARGGFDLVLGNPPWEKLQIEEKHFFSNSAPKIARATARTRKKLIAELALEAPEIHEQFEKAAHAIAATTHFLRDSARYPLAGQGNISTHSVFLELAAGLGNRYSRMSLLVPTGLATQESQKELFAYLVDSKRLVLFLDFENRRGIFPGVHRSFRFAIVTLAGGPADPDPTYGFFLQATEDMQKQGRTFSLSINDLRLISPNTLSCPSVTTERDIRLLRDLYSRAEILVRENPANNPWGWQSWQMFNETHEERLLLQWDPSWNEIGLDRFYEGKLIHQFDHRYATYENSNDGPTTRALSNIEKRNSHFVIRTHYCVSSSVWSERVQGRAPTADWILAFRRIARATDERTAIFAVLPRAGAGSQTPVALTTRSPKLAGCLLANLNSFALDYVARTKVGGTDLNHFIVHQLPTLDPATYEKSAAWSESDSLVDWISQRVVELTYTAWDLAPFARDCGYLGPPFPWNDERRALIRCELDAAFLHLYELPRDDAHYILDTFPIVKRHEEKTFGEYRTKRVILEIYDDLVQAKRTGSPFRTRLDPPPCDPRAAHQGGEPTIATSSENP